MKKSKNRELNTAYVRFIDMCDCENELDIVRKLNLIYLLSLVYTKHLSLSLVCLEYMMQIVIILASRFLN